MRIAVVFAVVLIACGGNAPPVTAPAPANAAPPPRDADPPPPATDPLPTLGPLE